MTFGNTLTIERERRGETLKSLGRRIGVTHVCILYAEQGKNIPPDDRIRDIAAALEIDPKPLLRLAALERGTLSIKQAPQEIQRLICRITHGENISPQTAAKLTAILDQEPVAA